jgi:hypothetical protein
MFNVQRNCLYPLVEHGYFANIFCSEKDIVCVDCTVYFSDYDYETDTRDMVRIDPAGPSTDNGKCVACNEGSSSKERAWTAHSIMCPGCNLWTKPYTLTAKNYRANFKIIPGKPAEFICALGPNKQPMPDHMIQCISDALINHSEDQVKAQTTQSLLQAKEAAEEASMRREQEEFNELTRELSNHLN